MENKIQELNSFLIDINKNPVINTNHSWIIEKKQSVDQVFTYLSKDYTDLKVTDFNNT
jgi:hypothetical protein